MTITEHILYLTHKINRLGEFILLVKEHDQETCKANLLFVILKIENEIHIHIKNNDSLNIIIQKIEKIERINNILQQNVSPQILISLIEKKIIKYRNALELVNHTSNILNAIQYNVSRPTSPFLLSDLTNETLEVLQT